MILNSEQIADILVKRPNRSWLNKCREYAEHARMHMTGEGKAKAIKKLDYFEDDRLLVLRQLYSPANVDFYGRLHRPIDKIWSAKGGSINYSLPESKKAKMNELVSDVYYGLSLKEWLRTYWLPAAWYDPMGLVMMEVGENVTYPKYHQLDTIFEMPRPKGRSLDWIILKLPDNYQPDAAFMSGDNIIDMAKGTNIVETMGAASGYYRVIDDMFDRTIYWNGSTAKDIEVYPNYFMVVPAVLCGDIWDDARKMFVSPDDATLTTMSKDEMSSIADKYMRERSTIVMYEMHHGFPLSWQYQSICSKCQGTGMIDSYTCDSCNGSTFESKKDASKLLTLPYPRSKEDPVITEPAGVIEVAVESWQEMKRTNEETYKVAHYTTWGTHQVEDSSQGGGDKTATGRFLDVQPVNDRLAYYSDSAEYMFMWVANKIAQFNFNTTGKVCEANFGRRYLIESPDEISKRLQDAVRNKMSYSFLRDLYMRWIDSEYSGDEMTRQRLILEFKLDPAPFMTTTESRDAFIDPRDYQRKLYYPEWLETLPNNWYLLHDYQYWLNARNTYIDSIVATQPPVSEEQNAMNV